MRAGFSDVVLIWLVAVLNYIFGFLYSTVYFYFTPFIPLALVIYQSHSFRHVPEASWDDAFMNKPATTGDAVVNGKPTTTG